MTEIKCGKLVKEFEKAYVPPKTDPPIEKEKPVEAVSETKNGYSIASAVQKLNEDDLLALFKALIIKAGVGKPDALIDMTKITKILMK